MHDKALRDQRRNRVDRLVAGLGGMNDAVAGVSRLAVVPLTVQTAGVAEAKLTVSP